MQRKRKPSVSEAQIGVPTPRASAPALDTAICKMSLGLCGIEGSLGIDCDGPGLGDPVVTMTL